MNSRPYGRQLLIIHRAGFILKGFTLPFGPETSGSKERAFSPAKEVFKQALKVGVAVF